MSFPVDVRSEDESLMGLGTLALALYRAHAAHDEHYAAVGADVDPEAADPASLAVLSERGRLADAVRDAASAHRDAVRAHARRWPLREVPETPPVRGALPTSHELVDRAVRGLETFGRVRGARWAAVMAFFRLSASQARALCESFGVDPDEMIGPETIRLDAGSFVDAQRIRTMERMNMQTDPARGPFSREELGELVAELDGARLDRALAARQVMRGDAATYVALPDVESKGEES